MFIPKTISTTTFITMFGKNMMRVAFALLLSCVIMKNSSASSIGDSLKNFAVSIRWRPQVLTLGAELRCAPRSSLELLSYSALFHDALFDTIDSSYTPIRTMSYFVATRLEFKYFLFPNKHRTFFHEGAYAGWTTIFSFRPRHWDPNVKPFLHKISMGPVMGYEQPIIGPVYFDFRLRIHILSLDIFRDVTYFYSAIYLSRPLTSSVSIKYTF